MANTFTQIYIHVVFTVAGREYLIHNQFKDEIYKYITGIMVVSLGATGIIRYRKHKIRI